MKYLLIFFFMMLNIIYLTDSSLDGQCLTFRNLKIHSNNACLVRTFSELMVNTIQRRSCLECEIKDNNIVVAKSCRRYFTCVSFLFDNNTMFEQFFREHPNIIHYLQSDDKHISTILMITIASYTLTEISFKYLNSLLYINLPSFNVLQVKFIKPIPDMEIINIKNDFSDIPIDGIYLTFSCNYHINDNEWIEYVIKSNDMEPKVSGICQRSHFSTQLLNTSNNIM